MKRWTIYDGHNFTVGFTVEGYGNGYSYVITDKKTGKSVNLQADIFDQEMQATNDFWTLEDLCAEYSDVMS